MQAFNAKTKGTSPWEVFSMIRAGNFKLGGYAIGIVLLILLMIGMVCAGTLFLPFFLSDGCCLFPTSGTAVPDTGKRA